MKINIKWLLYLPIIFLFLPAFSFYIPALGGIYSFYFISIYVVLLILFITNGKDIIKKLKSTYSQTPLKYFVWLTGLVILDAFILCLLGTTTITQTLRSIVMRLILSYFVVFIYFIYIIGWHISLKKFIKCFIFLFWINLILGIIAYIGQLFDIIPINSLFDFFANERILKYSVLQYSAVGNASNYTAYGLPRLDNLFVEPSFYARFLFIFLPMSYTVGLTKIKLFKKTFLNIILKRTIIPLTWINILLTQSPIYLIFCLIITFCYFFKTIFFLLKKHFLPFLFSFIFIINVCFVAINKLMEQDSYLLRIFNFITNVRSLDSLASIDASLYTRVVDYTNITSIFLKYPLLGTGIGNLDNFMNAQFINSPLPLSIENCRNLNYALYTKTSVMYGQGFIYCMLATYGIFITLLLVFIHYKLIKYMCAIYKETDDEFMKMTAYSLKWILVVLSINFFYQLPPMSRELWFIYVLCIAFIYVYKIYFRKEKNSENNING